MSDWGWCCKEDGDRLFSVVSSERTRSNRHKLQYSKFHLNIRKDFFHCEGGQTPEHSAHRDCGVPASGSIQNLVGLGPDQSALADPALSWKVRV